MSFLFMPNVSLAQQIRVWQCCRVFILAWSGHSAMYVASNL